MKLKLGMIIKNKRLLIAGAAGLLLAALLTGFLVAQHKILYHFAAVEPGKVYRSGTLSDLGLKWVHAKTGFKTFINLRSEKENREAWYQREKNFAQARGLKLIDIPMPADTPPTPDQIKYFLEVVRNPENLPVIIHCHQGVTRTAMMVAVYEIAVQGKPNQLVLEKMPMFGHRFDKKDKQPVRDFILQYQP